MATIETAPADELDFRILSSIDEIQMPELQEVYKYWLSIKGDLEAPDPDDFDLLDIADSVSTSGVIEVIDEGDDFRFLFLGQGFTDMIRNDYTGKLASEVAPDVFTERSTEILRLAITNKAPVINGLRTPSVDLANAEYIESLTLPLISGGVVRELAFALTAPYLE